MCIVSRDDRLFHQLVISDSFVRVFCMTILLSNTFSPSLSPSLLSLSLFLSVTHCLFKVTPTPEQLWNTSHQGLTASTASHPFIHCTSEWESVCAFLNFTQRCLAYQYVPHIWSYFSFCNLKEVSFILLVQLLVQRGCAVAQQETHNGSQYTKTFQRIVCFKHCGHILVKEPIWV